MFDRGQGPTPGCVQRAGQCSQGLDLLFGKVDSAAHRLEALINAKQAIARRLDAAQVRGKILTICSNPQTTHWFHPICASVLLSFKF